MKKKIIIVFFIIMLIIIVAFTAIVESEGNYINVYSPTENLRILSTEEQSYLDKGYKTEPCRWLFSRDGKMEVVIDSQVEDWIAVGWYYEPQVLLYALDGRTEWVGKSQVEAQLQVGWYIEPQILLYASDGRTIWVNSSEVENWLVVGWSKEPFNKAFGYILKYSEKYETKHNRLNKRKGVVYCNGHKETYYSQKVLPGGGLKIPGRHVANDGTIRDKDGYICVAAHKNYYPKGATLEISLGPAKVYDTGCAYGIIDVYVNW